MEVSARPGVNASERFREWAERGGCSGESSYSSVTAPDRRDLSYIDTIACQALAGERRQRGRAPVLARLTVISGSGPMMNVAWE